MQTATDLRNLLARIDRKGYPAYKDTKGAYQFPDYVLSIDHVQGDPFAAPSKVSIHVRGSAAAFPPSLYRTPVQRIALQDALTPSVRPAGGSRVLPGQGLGTQRADLGQPLRAGGLGAHRLLSGPHAR